MPPEIRELQTSTELADCYRLQQAVWGRDDELLDVTALERAWREGAILLGAFERQLHLIGFVLSHPIPGAEAHHSHMLAVQAGLRDRGIGLLLKQSQIQIARSRGIRWLVWTFDPLEARNCHLNLNRLGAFCFRYFVDFYPGSRSVLHAGLDTDRLLAELDLGRNWLPSAETGKTEDPPHIALEAVRPELGPSEPGPLRPEPSAGTVLIEVPLNIQGLKESAPELAVRWRSVTREAFLFHLEKGFVVNGLVRTPEGTPRRVFHRLRRCPGLESIAASLDFTTRPFSSRKPGTGKSKG